MTYRIWIDQDSVLYDLSTPWYRLHNHDYPNHNLKIEHVDDWNTQSICDRHGCNADIYSYFKHKDVWECGGKLENSYDVTLGWKEDNIADIGVLTTTPNSLAPSLKMKWMELNYPHIKDMIIVNGHFKSLVAGDILIDDGIHNIETWKGIGILYSQPWNKDGKMLRATTWNEVDLLVRISINLLNQGWRHKDVEYALYEMQVMENIIG